MRGKPFTIVVGRRQIEAELFAPDGQGPWPGVLVLHELFGLSSNVRSDARDLARNGFVAVAPDLYSGHSVKYCMRMFFSPAALAGRGNSEQVTEIHYCLDALKDLPECNGTIGMMGMCLTGGFVLQMARRPDMKAPVVFHHSFGIRGGGMPKAEAAEVKNTIQGHFGADDRVLCPKSRVEALARDLGDRLEVNMYDGVGHGMRSNFRYTAQSRQAWEKTIRFFKEHLMASSGD